MPDFPADFGLFRLVICVTRYYCAPQRLCPGGPFRIIECMTQCLSSSMLRGGEGSALLIDK